MMMQASLFSKSFELLDLHPVVSPDAINRIAAFEAQRQIKLPPSLSAWYSLDNHRALLQEIVGSHSPVVPEDAHTLNPFLAEAYGTAPWLPVLAENQGVYYLAVRLDEGDDPPVYVRYNEVGESWQLHARSFSEWVYALAWDHSIDGQWERYLWNVSDEQLSAYFAGADEIGPETRLAHLWFRAERFVRIAMQGKRYTLLVGEPPR